MELFDRSILAKQQGDEAGSLELLRSAFEQERSAANLVADQLDFESTQSPLAQAELSVLHRSAASLAVECCQLREAEWLIGRALAGNPPQDIMSYEICCWMRCIRSVRRFDFCRGVMVAKIRSGMFTCATKAILKTKVSKFKS
jgi:hypothetical protein